MKIRISIKLAIISLTILLASCDGIRNCIKGDDNYVIETRIVSESFTGIEMDGSFNVFVKKDTIVSIEVETDANVQPYVITRVRGGRLLIDNDKQCFRTKKSINVYVSIPFIDQIILDGSGIIECDTMDADIVELELNGSGEIFVDEIYANDCSVLLDGSGAITINKVTTDIFDAHHNSSGEIITEDLYANEIYTSLDGSGAVELYRIDASDIEASLSGSGYIHLEGFVDYSELSITGSGNIEAFRLKQIECDAYISGSGSIYTFVIDYLTADIPGSGNIFYMGDPRRIYLVEDTDKNSVIPSN